MGAFRKELVAHMQLLLGADAHECFDIRLLERTEHVVDFLHGSLLGRGEPRNRRPLLAERYSMTTFCRSTKPASFMALAEFDGTERRIAQKSPSGCCARSASGAMNSRRLMASPAPRTKSGMET